MEQDTLLERFYWLFLCFVCGVLKVSTAYVTGFSTSCSSPSLPYPPSLPPSRLTPLCPFGLDSTLALYATCPSARLYLREPQALSLELSLLGFWPRPPPPPFSLSFVLVSFCSPLSFTNTARNSDCLSVTSSIWTHAQKKTTMDTDLPLLSPVVWMLGCHLSPVVWMLGTQVHTLLPRREWLQPASVSAINVYLKVPKEPNNILDSWLHRLFFFSRARISANRYNPKISLLFQHVFFFRCSLSAFLYLVLFASSDLVCMPIIVIIITISNSLLKLRFGFLGLFASSGRKGKADWHPKKSCCLWEKGYICSCREQK